MIILEPESAASWELEEISNHSQFYKQVSLNVFAH